MEESSKRLCMNCLIGSMTEELKAENNNHFDFESGNCYLCEEPGVVTTLRHISKTEALKPSVDQFKKNHNQMQFWITFNQPS